MPLPFAYDDAGNTRAKALAGDSSLIFTHDAWNRLVRVDRAATSLTQVAEYEYNGLHQRIIKRVDTSGSATFEEGMPGCGPGEILDCNGNCAPASWVGDGICDDGSYYYQGVPIYFDCPQYNNDGGDCDVPSDPVNEPPDHGNPPDQPEPPDPEEPDENNLLFITHGAFTTSSTHQAEWQPLKPELQAILGEQWHVWVHDWSPTSGLSQKSAYRTV